ncbi:MAG TPA: GAF domain-containing sensor histidine kinase [Thermoanaerobaculia bacterium]
MTTREESEPAKPAEPTRRAAPGRRPARETERRARGLAESLGEATVRLTGSRDRETVLATLLECLRGLVRFDRAQAMLVEEAGRLSVRAVFDGERVVALPAGERPEIEAADHPVLRQVLSTGAVVSDPDEASSMGVPILARGEVAGLFTLARRQPRAFDEEDVRVARAMASQASVAVENAVLYQQMEASKARLRWLSRRLVEAQERERRHVARELHDEAGQALASLRFGLRLLEREVAEGGDVGEHVTGLLRTTDAVIDGLHRLAADLRPASLDHLGLDAALRQHARAMAATHGLHVRFKARGFTGERLPPVVETALFRVVQEAVTNVVRHARARRVDVLLEHRGDRVLAMVEDDGIGFDPDRAQSGEHFGLVGLRERAEALDGSLTVESAPGAGTTVVVEVASADPHPDR